MPDNRIGVTIDARTTGKESLREHVNQVQQLNAGWKQYNDIQKDAEKQFPENLKKQNTFIRQQLGMLKELETVGTRERISKLRAQKEAVTNKQDQQRVQQQINREQQMHVESDVTFAEAKAYAMQAALDQGIGEPDADLMAQLTGAGIRGGGFGIAQAGARTATAAITRRMAGMGLGGKMALGVGGGLGIGLAIKGVMALKEGWDLYKNLAPELLNIAAISGKLPDDAERYRDVFLSVAQATATANSELIQHEKTLMRITGSGVGGAQAGAGGPLARIIDISRAYGIDPGAGTRFAGQMAMTGYQAGMPNEDILRRTIAEGLASGIGAGRLPEFLEGVQNITNAVMRTAVTVDPGRMAAYGRAFGQLGVPFQGARGAQIIGGIQQGMQGGMGFQAARRILEQTKGIGNFGIADVIEMQQQGLNDPRMFASYMELFGEMAGVDGKTGAALIRARKNQAMMISKATGIPMRALFNEDADINSILEMDPAKIAQMTKTEMDAVIKDRDRIDEFKETFGFKAQQADVSADIAKINAAAFSFENGAGVFYEAVRAMADVTLGDLGTIGPRAPEGRGTNYDASEMRKIRTGEVLNNQFGSAYIPGAP